MDETIKTISKRRSFLRKILLKKLLDKVLNNQFNNLKESPVELFNEDPARKSYISPIDRSTNNYGYMTISEIGAGSPTVW